MKKFAIILLIISLNINGQKKVLDHKDFDIWNRIQNSQISSNGDFIMYSLQRGEEDSFLKIISLIYFKNLIQFLLQP